MDIDKFKTYNEDFLKERYEYKKQQCKQRLIPFEFTLQQWLDFHKVLYSGVGCAYLNQGFVFIDKHKQFPTIERLSDAQPYSVSNCVWVCHLANQIKDQVAKGKPSESFDNGVKNFAKRIEKILSNKSLIEIIQEPYQHLFNQAEQGDNMSESYTPVNREITITKLYAEFVISTESVYGAEYQLSYTQFKQLISRKNCQLTGRKLPEDISDRSMWVVDKTKPVSKGNVLVCDKTLCEALDALVVSAKLSFKDLQKIAKVLGK